MIKMRLNINIHKNKLLIMLMITLLSIVVLSGCNSGVSSFNNSPVISNQQYLTAKSVVPLKTNLSGSNSLSEELFHENLTLNSIAKGSGVYVAVGNDGLINTSLDGVNWSSKYLYNVGNLSGVVYNPTDRLFYAIGISGALFTSKDGESWASYKTLNPALNLKSIMVVEQGNIVIGSDCGVVFEINSSGRRLITVRALDPDSSLISAAYNYRSTNGLMVLGSDNGSIWYKKSSDWSISNWTSGTKFFNGAINNILFESADNLFLAVTSSGSFIMSPTGVTWSSPITVESHANLKAVAMDPLTLNAMIAGSSTSGTKIITSTDFNYWHNNFLIKDNVTINDMKCFNNNDCVAVGKNSILFLGLGRSSGAPVWSQVWSPISYKILDSGQVVTNENGTKEQILFHTSNLELILQRDSNVVCYVHSGTGISWASASNKDVGYAAGKISMEESGNLVVNGSYPKSYSSETNSHGAYLIYDYTTQKINIVDKNGLFLKNICG